LDEVTRLINNILQTGSFKSDEILILARSNDNRTSLVRSLWGQDIKILTYHQSKGLEKKCCVLVGDCFYKGRAEFKNLIYKLAGYKQTYDEAQKDEAMRLAYVALTRSIEKCYWFVQPKVGGAALVVISK